MNVLKAVALKSLVRSTKPVMLGAAAALALTVMTSRPAAADQYYGQAYVLKGSVGVGLGDLLNLGIGAEINRVDLPHPNGGGSNSLNSSGAGLSLGLGSIVNTGLVNASTSEVGTVVSSNVSIASLNLLPNINNFLALNLNILDLNLLGIVKASVTGISIGTSLTTAGVIQSQAIDTPFSSASGSSTVTGLNILGNSVTADGSINQVVPINLSVDVSLLGIGLVNTTVQVGEVIINEQTHDIAGFPDSIRVNALHVKLFPSANINANILGIVPVNVNANLLGDVANTDLIFASSAAAAAPEPGSLALLIPSIGLIGLARRRRRIAK